MFLAKRLLHEEVNTIVHLAFLFRLTKRSKQKIKGKKLSII